LSKNNKEVRGIWKYLHHLLSGAIFLIEGLYLLLFLKKSIFISYIFIIIGVFLIIDDLLAETINISVFNNLHSNPIKLKIAGLIFFIAMEILFIFILFY